MILIVRLITKLKMVLYYISKFKYFSCSKFVHIQKYVKDIKKNLVFAQIKCI
jgi:hypothetical protein